MVETTEAVMPWHTRPVTATQTPEQPVAGKAPEAAMERTERDEGGFKPFGDDGFSFLDLIDVVNPLHHIPVIGPVYRELTGDVIDPLPRITGSTLYLGPIGAGLSVADVVLEETTGKDAGAHVFAFMRDGGGTTQTVDAGAAGPAAAGTDGEDPVTAWARAELAYRARLAEGAAPESDQAATAPEGTDPVTAWAEGELAARREGPADGNTLAAAGTDGEDPGTAWARAEVAYHQGTAALAPGPDPAAVPRGPAAPWNNNAWTALTAANGAAEATAKPADVTPAARPVPASAVPDARNLLTALGVRDMSGALAALNAGHKVQLNREADGEGLDRQKAKRAAAAYGAPPALARPAVRPPASVTPGATAPTGGWFAGAMLKGLDRYDSPATATASDADRRTTAN